MQGLLLRNSSEATNVQIRFEMDGAASIWGHGPNAPA